MILHIVLFKFNEGVTWADNQLLEAEAISKSHMNNIPEIQRWITGRNMIVRDQAADFCVMGFFKNEETLKRYQIDEDHQKGVKAWSQLSTWQVIDLNLELTEIDELFQLDLANKCQSS